MSINTLRASDEHRRIEAETERHHCPNDNQQRSGLFIEIQNLLVSIKSPRLKRGTFWPGLTRSLFDTNESKNNETIQFVLLPLSIDCFAFAQNDIKDTAVGDVSIVFQMLCNALAKMQ